MYTLYTAPLARSLMVEMVLAEGGISYETRSLDMRGGEHRDPAYLAVNPAGWIPALVTPEGETIYETPAINLWLCERHGLDLVPPPGDPDRGSFLSAFFNVTGEIEPTLKRAFYPARYAIQSEQIDAVRDQAWQMVADRLAPVEVRLSANGPCILGTRYSLADLQLVYWMPYVARQGLLGRFTAIGALYEQVKARPALQPIFAQLGN